VTDSPAYAPLEAPESSADTIRDLAGQLRPALVGLVMLTALTGGVFPLAVFALAHAAFPTQAAGSLETERGVVVGSHLIGQAFTTPGYFRPRPSAAGAGYDGTASGGSNLPPSSAKLAAGVRRLTDLYRRENGLAPGAAVPIDAVTASGSGLDPDISPDDAALQTGRVARARGLPEERVKALVEDNTKGRQLGFLGEARVSVLDLNLALDRATGR
jgi:potassium-transporting ATPase KdpC subunit